MSPPAAERRAVRTFLSDEERAVLGRIREDVRPWGKFRAYPHENAGGIKIITVNPGSALSLQLHRRRSELWVALDEGLEITVGDRTFRPAPNEEILIPRETPHRLRGVGERPARVMEIWLGDSDEDDIVRLEDLYGRT
jgi:mannose-6-phosphate isomerase-like protein (cupin superfamily)